MTTTKCERCGGAGTIEAFRHIANGECFDCGGTGRVEGVEARAVVAGPQKFAEALGRGVETIVMAYQSDAGLVVARTIEGGDVVSRDRFDAAEGARLVAAIEARGRIDTRKPFWA